MTKNEDGTVTITLEAFQRFLSDQQELNQLYAAGVDNWEGYSEAVGDDDEDDEDD